MKSTEATLCFSTIGHKHSHMQVVVISEPSRAGFVKVSRVDSPTTTFTAATTRINQKH